MNVTTATPAQIDAEIARINGEIAKLEGTIERAEKRVARVRSNLHPDTGELSELGRQIDIAAGQINGLEAELVPFQTEFQVRGGWTRYYLVEGGHLHYDVSGWRCSRIPTTSHYWLTELSGQAVDEVIELAGERVCTVCFPDAPVAVQNRPSQLLTKTEAEKAEAARERAAKSAQAAATKVAKAITAPDGSPLVYVSWGRDEKVSTEAAAQADYREAVAEIASLRDAGYQASRGIHQTVEEHEAFRTRVIENLEPRIPVLLAALAAKHGITAAEEAERHAKPIAAKVRKIIKEAADYRAAHPTYFA